MGEVSTVREKAELNVWTVLKEGTRYLLGQSHVVIHKSSHDQCPVTS